jgi:hypothetical protein
MPETGLIDRKWAPGLQVKLWALPRKPNHSQKFPVGSTLLGLVVALLLLYSSAGFAAESPGSSTQPPYPPSPVIENIAWDWSTYKTAARGSDLWPVTWAADGNLYCAWGDGGGFGGSDQAGRVAMGFARLRGNPPDFAGENVNGGTQALHAASFPSVGHFGGKTGGITCVRGVLYAWENMQDGNYPDVDYRLIWSANLGATWQHSDWCFPKGAGQFKPATFLNFGQDYAGLSGSLQGYVYFFGYRQGDFTRTYLGRMPPDKLLDRSAYKFLSQLTDAGRPTWSADAQQAFPIFTDPNGGTLNVVYDPGIGRYLATSYHQGPGQLGVFDAPEPWGPWTTVYYTEHWGKMGTGGEGLVCSFPQKWMADGGRTLWCIFSAYGTGAKEGITAHDRFNLVKATLKLRPEVAPVRDARIDQPR